MTKTEISWNELVKEMKKKTPDLHLSEVLKKLKRVPMKNTYKVRVNLELVNAKINLNQVIKALLRKHAQERLITERTKATSITIAMANCLTIMRME